MPATISDFSSSDFAVVEQHRIFEQEIGNTVERLLTASLNRRLLITAARAAARLIFEVVAEQTTKLPLV